MCDDARGIFRAGSVSPSDRLMRGSAGKAPGGVGYICSVVLIRSSDSHKREKRVPTLFFTHPDSFFLGLTIR